jgi:hypothetical protein
MTEQEEKQTSIEYLIKKLYQLERDLIELEKQHEQSLKVAFDKGYEIGLKDGLISDEAQNKLR